MNFEALGNIGDFLGGIAVVVSVLYLAFNIRQNTKEVISASTQALLGKSIDIFTDGISGQAATLLAKVESDEPLTPEEQQRFRMFIRRNMQLFELVYLQYREGRVTDEVMSAYASRILTHLTTPRWRSEWEQVSHYSTKSFLQYVQELGNCTKRPH